MKKTSSFHQGFTLVELLVSIGIFVIFLGVVSTSYISIVRSQRQANDVRKMYSEIRTVMETLAQDARLGTIDYACYQQNADISQCPPEVKAMIGQPLASDGMSSVLVLYNKDIQEKTVYFFDVQDNALKVKKYAGVSGPQGNTWNAEEDYKDPQNQGFKTLLSSDLQVKNLHFMLFPPVNPYASDDQSLANQYQFQPKITVFLSVENTKTSTAPFHLDLQTTISSRVYSRK